MTIKDDQMIRKNTLTYPLALQPATTDGEPPVLTGAGSAHHEGDNLAAFLHGHGVYWGYLCQDHVCHQMLPK